MDKLVNRKPQTAGSGPIRLITLELKRHTADTFNVLWGTPEDSDERERRTTYIDVTFFELEREVLAVMDAVDNYSAEESAAFLAKVDDPTNGETEGIACEHEDLFLIPETIGRAEHTLKLLVEVIEEEVAQALPRQKREPESRWNARKRTALKLIMRMVFELEQGFNDLLPSA